VVLRHLKETHKVQPDKIKSFIQEITSNDLLFGNKMTRFIPALQYPISESLHQLIEDLDFFNNEINAANQKLRQIFSDFKIDLKIVFETPENISVEDSRVNVYIKLVESYLSNLKQKNKQYSFRRFIIGLLTGWIGETTNFDHRETNHASSTNLYLTIRIHFHRLPSLFQKVIEHVVLQLLNNDNVVNNSNSGEHYYIDHLSAHEHVYLVLGLLKKAFYLFSELSFQLDFLHLERTRIGCEQPVDRIDPRIV